MEIGPAGAPLDVTASVFGMPGFECGFCSLSALSCWESVNLPDLQFPNARNGHHGGTRACVTGIVAVRELFALLGERR